jgi:hypothetical protein
MFWCSKASDQTLNITYRHKTVHCECLHSLWPVASVFFLLLLLRYFSGYLKITSSFNSFEITKGSQLPGVEWHTLNGVLSCLSLPSLSLSRTHARARTRTHTHTPVCSKVQGFTTALQDMVCDILVSYTVSKHIFVNYFSSVIGIIILLHNCINDSLCYSLNSVIHQVSHFTKTVKSLTTIVFTFFYYLCEVFIKLNGQ